MILREAVAKGLREALEDDRVFIMGEDIGAYGGAYAVTRVFSRRVRPCANYGDAYLRVRNCSAGVWLALAG